MTAPEAWSDDVLLAERGYPSVQEQELLAKRIYAEERMRPVVVSSVPGSIANLASTTFRLSTLPMVQLRVPVWDLTIGRASTMYGWLDADPNRKDPNRPARAVIRFLTGQDRDDLAARMLGVRATQADVDLLRQRADSHPGHTCGCGCGRSYYSWQIGNLRAAADMLDGQLAGRDKHSSRPDRAASDGSPGEDPRSWTMSQADREVDDNGKVVRIGRSLSKACEVDGKLFTARRANARFCSRGCQEKALRKRNSTITGCVVNLSKRARTGTDEARAGSARKLTTTAPEIRGV